MIVVDTSALVAILRNEPEEHRFARLLAEEPEIVIGAPTKFELLMVMTGSRGIKGRELADDLLRQTGTRVEPWTDALTGEAAQAFHRFGKGRHPARLNFGDCMAYALAKYCDAPLLFKGNDFRHTM